MTEAYIQKLKTAGFSKVEEFEYDAEEYYETLEDLIFLLTHTPIIPDFGEKPDDLAVLNGFIEENRQEQGIRTNSKRFLLIAKR